MRKLVYRWADLDSDSPVPLLRRQAVRGEQMLAAMVHLDKGCKVALHSHVSEQFAYVMSGRVRWGVGAPGTLERREFESSGGEIVHLPSELPHEVEALEDTQILDILAPPGPMGIDAQRTKPV